MQTNNFQNQLQVENFIDQLSFEKVTHLKGDPYEKSLSIHAITQLGTS